MANVVVHGSGAGHPPANSNGGKVYVNCQPRTIKVGEAEGILTIKVVMKWQGKWRIDG